MATTFTGGQAMPAVGTPAYSAAQSNTGAGTFNATTGVLNVAGKEVYTPPVVQQTTTAQRFTTAQNVTDFNTNILPTVTASSAKPAATSSSVTINKGDTLSALALKYGTTVQDLVKANASNPGALPDPNNPNMILTGGNLNLPQSIGGNADTTTTNNGSGTSNTGAGASGTTANAGTSTTNSGSTTGGTTDTGTATNYDDGTEVVTGNQSIDKQIKGIKDEGAAQIAQITSTLDKIMSSTDAATQTLIASLKGNYDEYKTMMDDKLQSLKGGLDQSNIRTGRARYAPILAQGIITNAEVQEAQKLSDAFNKMMLNVSKAQQAQDNNDTKAFNTAYNAIKGVKSEMTSSIQKLYTLSNEQVKAKQAQVKADAQAKKDYTTNSINVSKAIVPAVTDVIKQHPEWTEEDRNTLIQSVAKEYDIDAGILEGEVSADNRVTEKSALAAANTASTIANRNKVKEPAGSTTKPKVDGGLSYTNSDIGEFASVLNKGTVGPDGKKYAGLDAKGYANIDTYQKLFQTWKDSGGTVTGFVKEFPPIKYVNPDDNDKLPTYLKNTSSAKAGTTVQSNIDKITN